MSYHRSTGLTASFTPPEPSLEQCQLDEELARLQEQTRALRTRRNAFASIGRLPPEILSRIFDFLAKLPPAYGYALSWINVTYVCQRWRETALSCPSLWTQPSFLYPTWATEMLKRSKMAPLYISADSFYSRPKSMDAVKESLQHLRRIVELRLTVHESLPGAESLLQTIASQPAPILQSLILENASHIRTWPPTDKELALPAEFLQDFAPKLRHLELKKLSLPWNSSLYANLTELIIYDPGSMRPTMPQLLDALEKMFQLVELDLKNSLPTLGEDATAPPLATRKGNLPQLTKLCVEDRTVATASFLNHASFPCSTIVTITCSNPPAMNQDFGCLLAALSGHFQSSPIDSGAATVTSVSGITPRTLSVEHLDFRRLRFQIWDTFTKQRTWVTPFPNTKSRKFYLELQWLAPHRKTDTVIESVCAILPLQKLRVLHVHQQIHLQDRGTWTTCFGSLPHLQTICLTGLSCEELLAAVDPAGTNADKTKRKRIRGKQLPVPGVFPALRSLSFEDVDFSYGHTQSIDVLMDCLFSRSGYEGSEMHQLQITSCRHLYDKDVALLEDIVADVSWDGEEIGDEDEEEEDDEEDYGGMYDDYYEPPLPFSMSFFGYGGYSDEDDYMDMW